VIDPALSSNMLAKLVCEAFQTATMHYDEAINSSLIQSLWLYMQHE